jgi:hypothetical protein
MGVATFVEMAPLRRELIYRIVDRYIRSGGQPFDLDRST